jgi:hypothetical protein
MNFRSGSGTSLTWQIRQVAAVSIKVGAAIQAVGPRQLASVMHEARRYTFEAIRTLAELMRTAESESVRLNAAEAVLSRGWGRPTQALQIDERFLTKKLNDLTPDEIKALDERVAMIESDQGVLALTDETESPKPGNIENHEQTAADHP